MMRKKGMRTATGGRSRLVIVNRNMGQLPRNLARENVYPAMVAATMFIATMVSATVTLFPSAWGISVAISGRKNVALSAKPSAPERRASRAARALKT